MRIAQPLPAIVRSASIVCAFASLAAVAQAADWSDWQGLPDRYQGKVLFRLQQTDKKDGFRYQFRNDYGQKVTIKFAIAGLDKGGSPQKQEATIVLAPGEQALKGTSQQAPYTDLTSAGITEIQFDGAPPKPTLGGFYSPSIDVAGLEKAVTKAAKDLEREFSG